eukprot:m.199665 g.199665  ORF g.199665 m.199665 type:complete len:89 (+) comp13700_c0_seq2:1158-1424(+)
MMTAMVTIIPPLPVQKAAAPTIAHAPGSTAATTHNKHTTMQNCKEIKHSLFQQNTTCSQMHTWVGAEWEFDDVVHKYATKPSDTCANG